MNVYKDNPQPGQWTLALDWLPPVADSVGLAEPFSGRIQFNQVHADANLPSGKHAQLNQGQSYTFDVKVKNTAQSPESFFLDPRLPSTATIQLPNENGAVNDQNMRLPLRPGLTFPFYVVPSNTSELQTSLTDNTSTAPLAYDIGTFAGDPDLYGTGPGNTAAVDYNSGDEVMPGLWFLNPSEIGPYPNTGAPSGTASADFTAVTQSFDSTVDTGTGDMWLANAGVSSGGFDPVYLQPGQTATVPLTITPTASPGTQVSGVIDLNDAFQVNFISGFEFGSGDELASLPFNYTVK